MATNKDRKRKFIADMLEDLGTPYSERNIQKLLYIIQNAPSLLDNMDNNDRIVESFYQKAQIHAGDKPAPELGKPSPQLNDADDNDRIDQSCDHGNGKPTGIKVLITVIRQDGEKVTKELDTSEFCRSCIINRITFEAINPVIPPDEGVDPDLEDAGNQPEDGGQS